MAQSDTVFTGSLPRLYDQNLNSVFFVAPRVSNFIYSTYFTEPFFNAMAVG